MVIDVTGTQLHAAFLRETGSIDDQFTIIKGAGPEEFRIVRFQHAAQTVASWTSVAGEEYRVETSSSLQPASWSPVSEWIRATGATTHWTNALPPEPSPSFYRVEKR